MTYYNDIATGRWLRYLIDKELIPDGTIDERSIEDITPGDLEGYTQVHLFAGIGGWAYALRLAGCPELGCWTASLPCPSFSTAGKGRGFNDPRGQLLYPFLGLVRSMRPKLLFGEQVEAAIKHHWVEALLLPLEREGYVTGLAVLPAAGVGAPHMRHRIYWGARLLEDPHRDGCLGAGTPDAPQARPASGPTDAGELLERPEGPSEDGGMADAPLSGAERHGGAGSCQGVQPQPGEPGIDGLVEDAPRLGRGGRSDGGSAGDGGALQAEGLRSSGFWDGCEWLWCRDGVYRPAQPGTCPVAPRLPGRVDALRGYGNAIVPQVAAEFIKAFMEVK
jgi:DNA (cytosine-5)-methyltransferase 1